MELSPKQNKLKELKMITLNKETIKAIDSINYYTEEDFIKDAKCYIKALQSCRLQYEVTKVSPSGMSRHIRITSFEGTMAKGYYRSYVGLLGALNYKFAGEYFQDIVVRGCGMDMRFNTNYNICHTLCSMKFISKAKCQALAHKI